jgi:dihydrofolate reductase
MTTAAAQQTSVTEKNKFVFTENLEKALNLAFSSEENIILFGKGGFAKSEFSNAFFNNLSITPFVQTMGSGTTTDRLFGGIDIKSFNETGKIEYLVENSFMNHEYVIFEELFDAPDYILEQ